MRLALKAQAQCARTIEVLATMKNPPAVFAKQANITNGNQQINNGSLPSNSHTQEKIFINQTNYWSINIMENGWTVERRQRQAELIQQWQPWKHSTGARTIQGKAVSSQNAFKHGMSKLVKQSRELLKAHKAFMNTI